jgi:hypothetical protein
MEAHIYISLFMISLRRLEKLNAKMAVHAAESQEATEMVRGLPELTKYWLEIRNYAPIGPIFDHVYPHNITGLSTSSWDKSYHQAYFLIISLDLWFKVPVQDFLNCIFKSGRDIEGRC